MNAPSDSPVLLAALDYAARGWPVFPCSPVNKRPLTGKESAPGARDGGLHLATTDATQIRAWWRKWPKAMIGVPTGAKTGNVLDLDLGDPQVIGGTEYLERLRRHVGTLPDTAIAETASGGYHLWFAWDPAHPVANGADVVPALRIAPADGATAVSGKKAKGAQVDIRGEGGYVIVPPSMRCDGRGYAWCPDPWDGLAEATPALTRILTKEEAREAKAQRDGAQPPLCPATSRRGPTGDASRDAVARYADAALGREASELAGTRSGGRNDRLNIAAMKLGQLVAAGALGEGQVRAALEGAAQQCGLVQDDGWPSVRATFTKGFTKGLSEPRDLSQMRVKAERRKSR